LPASVLSKGEINRITLNVTSKLVSERTNSAIQMIHVVRDRIPISLDVECIKNCHSNLYVADVMLHLRAICFRCRMPINYTWTLNGKDIEQDKPRLITKLTADQPDEIVVKLSVIERARTGYTELKLLKSKAPTVGECTIEPNSGIECTTRYHIRCEKGITLLHDPLLYTFRLGNIYEENNNSGDTFLYLNSKDSITVRICNFHFSCEFKTISFSVESMPNSSKNLHINAGKIFEEGKRQLGFCMLQVISDKEPGPVFLQYIQAIDHDRSQTLLELVNTLEISHNFMANAAPLNSFHAYVSSRILERVIFTFDFIRNDYEIFDMTEEICLSLGDLLTNIVNFYIDNKENLEIELIDRDFDDPHGEIYVDWSPFNITVTKRINRYATAVQTIMEIGKIIGEELSRYMHPEELHDYVTEYVNYKAEMIEKYESIKYTSNDTLCTFEVPLASIDNLREQLMSNNLMVHSWCFKKNLFWWAPEDWSPTTAVLGINIFGRYGKSAAQIDDTKQLYKLNLRKDDTIQQNLTYKTGVLYHSMVTYKVKLHGHANLLVEFLNTTKSLQILITMNVEPTLANLHDSNCHVSTGQQRSIVLKNYCPDDGIAYLAVYKAKSFDTSNVTYTFRLTAQECGVWGSGETNPRWMRQFCYSHNLEQAPKYAQCTINHMSMFAAKEYPINLYPIQKRRKYANDMPLNMNCIIFNIILIFGALCLLFWAQMRMHYKKINLIRVIKANRNEVRPEIENIVIHVHTGGMLLARTTANIKLIFKSDLGRYKVVIYQNPIEPHLQENTSCLLRVSDEKVMLPCILTISHDQSGRYPSWFCRSLQVDDLSRNLSYTFPIYSWIKHAQKIRISCYPLDSKHMKSSQNQIIIYEVNEKSRWKRFKLRFRHYIKFYFINWFMFQPILGPWRYNDNSCNAYGRICIWTCKTILTITLVFCYYKST
ncbi:hypothetical protein KR093_009752, partial [Drosophila rubida]